MTVRAPDAQRVTAVLVTNEISSPSTPAQSGVIAFPRFMAGDVDLCHVLALWHELQGDTRRAAELRGIGTLIRAELVFPGVIHIRWTLLDAGRVGMAAIRAASDPDSCITVDKVRPLTRRLSFLAIGVPLDVTAEG